MAIRGIRCHQLAALALAVLTLAACDNSDSSNGADSKRQDRAEKDRGSASMMIGDQQWSATSARAKLKAEKLSISASRMDRRDGEMSRQELKLVVDDFRGVGSYEAMDGGSMFVGVSLDVEKASADQTDEDTARTAAEMLGGSDLLMLGGAQVEITAADDQHIEGTFTWTPSQRLNRPAIRAGEFRAVIKN